jgi:hypothetical protein
MFRAAIAADRGDSTLRFQVIAAAPPSSVMKSRRPMKKVI